MQTNDEDGFKDVWISLEPNDSKVQQDLIHIGNVYKINNLGVEQVNDCVAVHVWTDETKDEYTKEFIIKKYVEEENND